MICDNGVQKKINNGIFFVCKHDSNKGNHCRFVRFCKETGEYILTTDICGNVCKNFLVSYKINKE